MAKAGISIIVDIEPIVKIKCENNDCIYHLFKRGYLGCNLKYVDIDQQGKCRQMKSTNKIVHLDQKDGG